MLDGIRGLAILLVLIAHYRFLPSDRPLLDRAIAEVQLVGFTGVDLFFALSGFLITGILWQSKGSHAYFRTFWTRRVLRIFPLYLAVLCVLFVALPLLRGGYTTPGCASSPCSLAGRRAP